MPSKIAGGPYSSSSAPRAETGRPLVFCVSGALVRQSSRSRTVLCVLSRVHRLGVVVLVGPALGLRGWCIIPRRHLRSNVVPKAEAVLSGQHTGAGCGEQPSAAQQSLEGLVASQPHGVPSSHLADRYLRTTRALQLHAAILRPPPSLPLYASAQPHLPSVQPPASPRTQLSRGMHARWAAPARLLLPSPVGAGWHASALRADGRMQESKE